MAANDTTVIGNYADMIKMQLPNGKAIQRVTASLAERDDSLKYLPAMAANMGLQHRDLVQTALPTAYLATFGGSWKESKSEYAPVTEELCMIRSTYRIPSDVLKNAPKEVGMARLRAEKASHMMACLQSATNIQIYGPTTPSQAAIVGLLQREPYRTYDYKFTWSAGGTGADKRNALLIKPGFDTVMRLYNQNHPTMGVEDDEKGEFPVTSIGTSSDEHRWDLWFEFMIQAGFHIADQRACKLICNIDAGPTDDPGEDLIDAIFDAASINAPTGGNLLRYNDSGQVVEEIPTPWILFCDERTHSKLRRPINNKRLVALSNENVYKRSVPMLDDIIIARMDALGYSTVGSGADAVAAAS